MLAALIAISCSASPSAPGYKVYVSNERDNTGTVLDSGTLTVLKTINVAVRPRGITVTKDSRHVLVCTSDGDLIQMIDTASDQVVDTLPSNPDPELFVSAPSGSPLHIANEDDNLVTVVDVVKKKIISDIPVGVEPEGIGISPEAKGLVNMAETTSMAHFIDTASFEIAGNVLVDSHPRFAEFTADSSQVWVSSEVGGTVSIIDTNTQQIIGKVSFAIPNVNQRNDPARGDSHHQGSEARVRGTRSGQQDHRHQRPDL